MAKDPQIPIPLLRAYLRDIDPNPPYAFQWPTWASWVLFAVLTVIQPEGLVLWVILAIAAPHIVRHLRRPRSEAERQLDAAYRAARRLKWLAADGRITKRMPPEVLGALERAAAAHHAAKTRVLSGYDFDAPARTERLDACLLACIQIAAPAARAEEQSKRDWRAVAENREFVGTIVAGIEAQCIRMEQEFSPDSERLAALRELETDLGQTPTIYAPQGHRS